jgi:hypothetical protein
LSERNRQINLAHEFVNLCNANGDGKGMQQHLAKLLSDTD